VAFLRGINMIGHRPIKMQAVQKAFEQAGFKNVKTVGASGNVVFDASDVNRLTVTKRIERVLEKTSGHHIKVALRTVHEIQTLADSQPFRRIRPARYTKFLVTFLAGKSKHTLQIPCASPEQDFKIIRVSGGEGCSLAFLSPKRMRTGVLSFMETTFGRDVTTRNWSTVSKILKS
jgi:uncharacterized protein (DUF1697 family)